MATRSAWSIFLLSALALLVGADVLAAEAAAGGDIVVVGVKGDVQVTMRGQPRAVKQGTVMELAASVRTGSDGSMQLRQGDTSVAISADSILELPAGQALGEPIDRLVQPKGNVYYDVGKRGARKLRVETPYLVAVIKGTQFNVAVQGENTIVSLFEGSLEIRATDGSDVVDLEAGEIAVRHAGDDAIRVLRMDTGEPIARLGNRNPPVGFLPTEGGSTPRGPDVGVDTGLAGVTPGAGAGTDIGASGDLAADVSTGNGLNVSVPTTFEIDSTRAELATEIGLAAGDNSVAAVGLGVDVGLDDGVDAGLAANVDLGNVNVDAGVDVGVDLGGGTVDAGLGSGVDLAGASVDVGVNAGVDLGAGAVDVGVDAGVDLGGAAVDVGLDTGVDLGGGTVDVGVDAGVDLGGAAVDVGLDTGVDLGGGTVDVGVDAGVDLGGAAVDVGLDTGVDPGGGTVDLGADAGVDLGGAAAVDVGADAGVDLSGGTVDVGVDAGADLGGTGVDVGADVGADLGAGAADVGVDAGVAGIDAGVDAGVDLGAGTVDAGVSVGGLDLGLGVDLGAGTVDLGVGTTTPTDPGATETETPAPSGDGGLLGGLLGAIGGLLGGGR